MQLLLTRRLILSGTPWASTMRFEFRLSSAITCQVCEAFDQGVWLPVLVEAALIFCVAVTDQLQPSQAVGQGLRQYTAQVTAHNKVPSMAVA